MRVSKVLIVQEGHWGSAQPSDYKDLISMYVRFLSDAYGSKDKKKAAVMVVSTVDAAEAEIRNEGIDVVIFVSRSMQVEAKRLAAMFPKTRVMIFTGLIPEGTVVWVHKAWLSGPDAIRDIVLSR